MSQIMRRGAIIVILIFALCTDIWAQATAAIYRDSAWRRSIDTTIQLREVLNFVFKNPKDGQEYANDIINIRIVLPYVRIARHIYADVLDQKQSDTKRQYRHYRKDMEKEMREKFEKEVKDLTISQGKVLFKLLGRETGQNSYHIIKECKNGFSAWTYQIVAKHYTYDLKQDYNPHREWILELAIRYLGAEYDPK
jgi:hypothetical protein